MGSPGEPTTSRAVSPDGTEIGYVSSGDGPPLVMLHGTGADRSSWKLLLPHLTPHATVHTVDRRGRGISGDDADYALQREFEDVAAVVEAVAATSGSDVDVFGHSFGGFCALGAAPLTTSIRRLVLYEPPWDPETTAPVGLHERLSALLADGDRDGLLETFYREVPKMSDEELATFRSLPSWEPRVAAAHTIVRELALAPDERLDPDQLRNISVPTLMLLGSESPPWARSATEKVVDLLPDARTSVLEGQEHIAHFVIPEALAALIVDFLRDGT